MEAETKVVELEGEKLDRLLANARALFSAEDFAEFEKLVNAYQHLLKLIGLLKYGSGVPFNRLANLQADIGVPLPAATPGK